MPSRIRMKKEQYREQRRLAKLLSMEDGSQNQKILPTGTTLIDHDDDADMSDEEESAEEDLKEDADVSLSPEQNHFENEIQATCIYCEFGGNRSSFYGKTKKYCSIDCSHQAKEDMKGMKKLPKQSIQTMAKTPQTLISIKPEPSSFDWSEYINETQSPCAPVASFHHCPMASGWDNITVGLKVEVVNKDSTLDDDVYWIATLIRISGYRGLMRYEGFGNDSSHDFWINLCIEDVHPVGWCATTGRPLVPPLSIQDKYVDWKDILVKRLTGARTLPESFFDDLTHDLNDEPLKQDMRVEVVDRTCVSAMRVATIAEITGGRLHLIYENSKIVGDEFWCHKDSPLVHPVGWAQLVGHNLNSSQEYKESSLSKIAYLKYEEDDATSEMFKKTKEPPNGAKFQVGMKLEAIDPLNLVSISVATVMKVLRNNYLMIGIDGSIAEDGLDWFCYHATSPCIFPVGFCEINSIPLTPPRGYKGDFKWFEYLKQTKAIAAPVKLFQKAIPKHTFRPGMKLEAADLMEPRLICVSTIIKVCGRLLRIRFDGWDESYDQWVDCESSDVYPVGWCEMVNYPLEGPRTPDNSPLMTPFIKKRKSKGHTIKGIKKKLLALSQWQKQRRLAELHEKEKGMRNSLRRNGSFHGISDETSNLSEDSYIHEVASNFGDVSELFSDQEEHKDEDMYVKEEAKEDHEDSHAPDIMETANDFEDSNSNCSPNYISQTDIMESDESHSSQQNEDSYFTDFKITSIEANSTMHLSSDEDASFENADSSINASSGIEMNSQLDADIDTTDKNDFIQDDIDSVDANSHFIPCLIDEDVDDFIIASDIDLNETLCPDKWSSLDVAEFLENNKCAEYRQTFLDQDTDGASLLLLQEDQIQSTYDLSEESSSKIYDLIKCLKTLTENQQ